MTSSVSPDQSVLSKGARPRHRAQSGAGRVHGLDRWLIRHMLVALGDPPINFVLWNGEEIAKTAGPVVARVVLRDRWSLWKLVLNPELDFGDLYSAGRLDVEGDLLTMLEAAYRCEVKTPSSPLRKTLSRWFQRAHRNTLDGSRANIHHHYDIGDDFYRLWLDDEMLYTCGYFPTPTATLEEAQLAKMEHVCRKLWLRPGERVVELGCGWGSLALYMARHYGVAVHAYNISREQIKHARRRARAEGLDERVQFIEDDYRNVRGQFDAVVSVGMLEHVGPDHYREFGAIIDRCLSPVGRGLIHSIGRDQPGPINPWIERRIFPGAYPPSLREMLEVVEPRGFCVLDVENLRLHYAETLRHWLLRFEAAAGSVARMFDEPFVRTWRLYLTGSLAAFTTGALQLFQLVLTRPGLNDIPWTRARLYENKAEAT